MSLGLWPSFWCVNSNKCVEALNALTAGMSSYLMIMMMILLSLQHHCHHIQHMIPLFFSHFQTKTFIYIFLPQNNIKVKKQSFRYQYFPFNSTQTLCYFRFSQWKSVLRVVPLLTISFVSNEESITRLTRTESLNLLLVNTLFPFFLCVSPLMANSSVCLVLLDYGLK